MRFRPTSQFLIALAACILLGVGIGYAYVQYQPSLAQWFSTPLYQTTDSDLNQRFEAAEQLSVQWSQLLPESEKAILQKYQQSQPNTPTEFADNILRSIEAASDTLYTDAMMSINTVDTFDNTAISISGFIVPIDYFEDKSLRNIFIVPYFGACIHFPPPPPNQIIFAQLNEGFTKFEMTQAYRLHGVLRRGLFEDPLGTSAYILDVVSIEPYYQEPDDFRQH